MVSIVVSIDGLRLEPGDRVEFFNGGSTETSQSSEYGAFNFRHLGILNSIDQCILCLGSMILQFLGCVLLAEWGDLVEIHFQIVRHLSSKFVLGCLLPARAPQSFRIRTVNLE